MSLYDDASFVPVDRIDPADWEDFWDEWDYENVEREDHRIDAIRDDLRDQKGG